MEKILVATQNWFGLLNYFYNWGYDTESIKNETAESLFHGIAANLEASEESGLSERLIEAGYEELDDVRLDGYKEFDEMGELYEVHEITLADCQWAIDKVKTKKKDE